MHEAGPPLSGPSQPASRRYWQQLKDASPVIALLVSFLSIGLTAYELDAADQLAAQLFDVHVYDAVGRMDRKGAAGYWWDYWQGE